MRVENGIFKSISDVGGWIRCWATAYAERGTEVPIKLTPSLFIDNLINRLYRLSQEEFPRHKNWNTATFILDLSQKYEIEYFWDEDLEMI